MFLAWIEQVLQTRLSWRLGVGGPPHSVTGWLNLASPSYPLAGHSHVIMLSQLEDPHEFDMFDPHNSWKTQKRLLSISTFLCLRILLKDRPRDHMVMCLESELIFFMETYGHYNFVRVIFGARETIQAYGSCCFGQGGGLAANCLRDQRGRKVPVETGVGSKFLDPFQMSCFNKCSCSQQFPSKERILWKRGNCV